MEMQKTGLNTYLLSFDLDHEEDYNFYKEAMKKFGKIEVVFIENGYAFELTTYGVVM